jgi:hypothetical protein
VAGMVGGCDASTALGVPDAAHRLQDALNLQDSSQMGQVAAVASAVSIRVPSAADLAESASI